MPVLDLAAVRALFPHTATQTYLNHAATGVYSTRVVEALEDGDTHIGKCSQSKATLVSHHQYSVQAEVATEASNPREETPDAGGRTARM